MPKLTPYIHSEDARKQAEFYVQALGGRIEQLITFGEGEPHMDETMKDKVMHLQVNAGGNTIFMTDGAFEPIVRSHFITFSLECESDAETLDLYTKLAEGGQVEHELARQPWGAYYGEVQDKFGVTWAIMKHGTDYEE